MSGVMPSAQGLDDGHATTLAAFVLASPEVVLNHWKRAVRGMRPAHELSEPALLDSVPQLLEAIGRAIARRDGGEGAIPEPIVEQHAVERVWEGFDLGQVVNEYSLLRDSILELWGSRAVASPDPSADRVLHRAIDRAISLSVGRFMKAQDRATGAEAQRHEQERGELLARERQARARAERAEAGQRFLSEATAILNSSLEYEKTLERVTSLAVPQLADWCAVDLVGADGDLRTVALAHTDPAVSKTAREMAARFPVRCDSPLGAPEVVRSGRAQMGGELPDAALASIAQNDQHLQFLRALQLTSYIVVPLSAHGRVSGALSLATVRASGRRYGQPELELAQHLGRRAGLAIENASLYREAQEAIRIRDQVLAIVSHDLRNPVSAAKMAAELMARWAREHKEARLLKLSETVQRSTSRMEHLIGDLMDMASLHGGRLTIDRRSHLADAIVQEAIEPFEPMAVQQGIHFRSERQLEGLRLHCDRERVFQVFSNLLGNAFKFCDRGDEIVVRAAREGDAILFAVADSGPGIPADERPRIFDAYWSAERKGKKGTGLGLFITRGVIEAHGGRIWVESQPGHGATFFFTLPLAQ